MTLFYFVLSFAVLLVALCVFSVMVAKSGKDVLVEVLTVVKKFVICCTMVIVMLCTVAFADEAGEGTAIPAPSPTSEVVPSLDDEPDAYDGVEEPLETEEPEIVSTPESTAAPTPTPTVVTEVVTVQVPVTTLEAAEVTPEPETAMGEEIPVIEDNSYKYQVLTALGYIEGLLIFLAAVVLCTYVYKFFRIFF